MSHSLQPQKALTLDHQMQPTCSHSARLARWPPAPCMLSCHKAILRHRSAAGQCGLLQQQLMQCKRSKVRQHQPAVTCQARGFGTPARSKKQVSRQKLPSLCCQAMNTRRTSQTTMHTAAITPQLSLQSSTSHSCSLPSLMKNRKRDSTSIGVMKVTEYPTDRE